MHSCLPPASSSKCLAAARLVYYSCAGAFDTSCLPVSPWGGSGEHEFLESALERISLSVHGLPGQVFGVAAKQAGCRGSKGACRLCSALGQDAGLIRSQGSARLAWLPLALRRGSAGHWEDAGWLGKAACSAYYGGFPDRGNLQFYSSFSLQLRPRQMLSIYHHGNAAFSLSTELHAGKILV